MPTAAQTLPTFTGAVVDGRFKLQEILGSGTFGVVYKAVEMRTAHLPTPTYRAIKIMRKAGRRQRELTNIRREVALHAAIGRVPGVVHMYDSWDDAVFFFLVLELCPGGDLFTQIRVRKVFKHNEALLRRTFIKLVDALQVCHDAGVAHRDLKPENILASEGAEDVYIADFGLATTKRKVAEFRIGTDGYMSPECIGEFTAYQSYCPRTSDVWAVGMILANMLLWQRPWKRADPSDAEFRAYIKDPEGYFLRAFPFSPEGAHILARALDIDPRRRASLSELRTSVLALDSFFAPVESEDEEDEEEEAEAPVAPVPLRDVGASDEDSSDLEPGSEHPYADDEAVAAAAAAVDAAVTALKACRLNQKDKPASRPLPPFDWKAGSTAKMLQSLHQRGAR